MLGSAGGVGVIASVCTGVGGGIGRPPGGGTIGFNAD
jgi:hypothetical protein